MAARCPLQLWRLTSWRISSFGLMRSVASASVPGPLQRRPKKPPNAFLMFSEEYRGQLKEENPDLSPKALVSLVAERYRNLDESTKQSYATQAQAMSEKWKQEVKSYAETLTEDEKQQIQQYYHKRKEDAQKRQKRAEARAQRANMPARNLSAFSFFIREFVSVHRSEFSQPREVMRAAAHEWNQLNDDEKKPFVDQAAADKSRYKEEMEQYLSRKQEATTQPAKRPANVFALFVKDSMSAQKGVTMQQASEQWRKMSDADKQVYRDKAADLRQQYKKDKVEGDGQA